MRQYPVYPGYWGGLTLQAGLEALSEICHRHRVTLEISRPLREVTVLRYPAEQAREIWGQISEGPPPGAEVRARPRWGQAIWKCANR